MNKIGSISLVILLIVIIYSPLGAVADLSNDSSSKKLPDSSFLDKRNTNEPTSETIIEKQKITSSGATSESSTSDKNKTIDNNVKSYGEKIYNPSYFLRKSSSILKSEEEVKTPFPVHYDYQKYDNYGEGLNNLFPQFGKSESFGPDSTIQFLKDGPLHKIGGIHASKTIVLKQNFEISGILYIEPWGLLDLDTGDGFSIGFHGDTNKEIFGDVGSSLGIKGIKNGYFFFIDLFPDSVFKPDTPSLGKSTTDNEGNVILQGKNRLFQTDSSGVRKEGPKAVFGDYYNSKTGFFTPFAYHLYYDQNKRSLNFSLKNYKGEEQTSTETNQFIIPDNIEALNFYSVGVSGNKRSSYKLNIAHAAFSEYKTNHPEIESFDVENNKYKFKLINPNASKNLIEPKNYPKGTKVTYILDNKSPIETLLEDNSSLSIDKLDYGNHRIQIKLKSLYSDDNSKYANYSDYKTYDFVDGKLSIISVPDTINFGESKRKIDSIHLKGIAHADLIVSDTRTINRKNDWQISLKETTKLIGNQVTLSYINRDNKKFIINDQNQPIEHNLANKPEKDNISNDWKQTERGLFLDIPSENQKIGAYSGSLTWTLQDTPQAN